ncbi:MAG: low molecular weight phosphotyrosine protein phosphatase [Salinibacterium sp.]|nr:low molecular weight phosphotyrosine protein phosphatase [Salinibacterium sp.]
MRSGSCEGEELRENERVSFERSFDQSARFRVCFVCTGNICRSPMAETVLKRLASRSGLGDRVTVTSAGTGDWHVGEPADERTLAALDARGYNATGHRGRQFDPAWFDKLDLVVVFDRSQERTLRAWAATDQDRSKVQLLLSFDSDQSPLNDVPDPYYSDAAMFDQVLSMIEKACAALFRQITPGIRQGTS